MELRDYESKKIYAIKDKDGEWIQPGIYEEFEHISNNKYILWRQIIRIGAGKFLLPLKIVEGEPLYIENIQKLNYGE